MHAHAQLAVLGGCMRGGSHHASKHDNWCAPIAEPAAAAEDAPNPKLPKLAFDCPDAAAGWPRADTGVALDAAGCPNAGVAWLPAGADCPKASAGVDCPDDDALPNAGTA